MATPITKGSRLALLGCMLFLAACATNFRSAEATCRVVYVRLGPKLIPHYGDVDKRAGSWIVKDSSTGEYVLTEDSPFTTLDAIGDEKPDPQSDIGVVVLIRHESVGFGTKEEKIIGRMVEAEMSKNSRQKWYVVVGYSGSNDVIGMYARPARLSAVFNGGGSEALQNQNEEVPYKEEPVQPFKPDSIDGLIR